MILDSSGRQKLKWSLKEIMLEIRNKICVWEKFPGTYKQGRAKKAFLSLIKTVSPQQTDTSERAVTDSWSPTREQPDSKAAF